MTARREGKVPRGPRRPEREIDRVAAVKPLVWRNPIWEPCQLCGQRQSTTLNVFYPADAEHDDRCSRYLRICERCVERMVRVLQGQGVGR
jgi:hypothetical protein